MSILPSHAFPEWKINTDANPNQSTLRDRFAQHAMSAFIGEMGFVDPHGVAMGQSGYQMHNLIPQYNKIAEFAYNMADAMMSAREVKP